MADEQHVEIGEIIFLDDEIIFGDEERRAVKPGRLQQRRGLGALRRRERAAIGRHITALEPFADGKRVVRHAHGAIDIGRRMHLVGPAQAALPAFALQLLGGRRQRIRHRGPDIGMAVAVEIDGVFDVVRRHELGQPHGAGPGAGHVGELDLPLVEDFQRLQKFVEEFFLALAEIGLRRQHADGVVLVAGAAVVGFAAEDGEQNGRRHAELLFDCRRACRDTDRTACGLARRDCRRSSLSDSPPASARIPPARPTAVPAGPAKRDRAATNRARARASPDRRSRATRRAPAPAATAIAARTGMPRPRGYAAVCGCRIRARRAGPAANETGRAQRSPHRTARMNRRGKRSSTLPS